MVSEKSAEDRRVRKTKKQLRAGLMQLLEKKRISDVSVRELTALVDVSRSTFYTYYRDIFDMVESLENELFTELNAVIAQYSANALSEILSAMLCDLYRMLAANADLCRTLLGKNGDIAFVERVKNLIRSKWSKEWFTSLSPDVLPALYDYYYEFIVQGCIGVMETWLAAGMPQTPEFMANLTEQAIKNGVHALHGPGAV